MGNSQPGLTVEQQIFSGQSGVFADRFFVAAFYICFGALAMFAGVFGRHAFQVPFLVVSLLVGLRFLMRAHCRAPILEQLRSKQALTIVLFALVLLVYAGFGVFADHERTRLLGKPAIVVVGLFVLAYVWAFRSVFNRNRIVTGMFYGILGAFAAIVIVSVWNWLILHGYIGGDDSYLTPISISIYSLNDALKILSVLLFFTVSGFADPKRALWAGLGLSLAVWILSFYTFGADRLDDGTLSVTRVDSDVVQFGLPLVLLMFLISYLIPKLMTHLMFLGIAALLILAPWIFQVWYAVAEALALPRATTFLVRAEIWDKIAQLSLQQPLLGHGLDATRYIGSIDFANKYYIGDEATHPHNMFVQTWMDMGLLGVLFGLLFCFYAWNKIRSLNETVVPAILAGIAMYVLFALATHSLWQTWSMILFIMMCVYTSLHVAERRVS